MITKQSSCKLFIQFQVLSYLCLWLCTQKFTIHVSRWSQPQQIREGSPSSSYRQVCVRDCMKRAQMTSWLHNCTRLIKMADIMLLSTCIQKTELWLTFQQCCCLWYWEMALALSLFNSITLKQCRALIVPIGLAGKGMKRFFYFFYFSRICNDNFKCSNLNENPKLSHEITPCSKVIWGFDGGGKISEQRFKEISLSHFLQCFFWVRVI